MEDLRYQATEDSGPAPLVLDLVVTEKLANQRSRGRLINKALSNKRRQRRLTASWVASDPEKTAHRGRAPIDEAQVLKNPVIRPFSSGV